MNNFLTMVVAGGIVLNLIFFTSTFIFVKMFKVRISGASVIASLCMTWISIFFMSGFFVHVPLNNPNVLNWVFGFILLIMLVVYLFWVWFFQPKSLSDMIRDEVKQKDLQKLKDQKQGLTALYKALRKTNTQEAENAKAELKKINVEINEIKFKRFFLLKNGLAQRLMKSK